MIKKNVRMFEGDLLVTASSQEVVQQITCEEHLALAFGNY